MGVKSKDKQRLNEPFLFAYKKGKQGEEKLYYGFDKVLGGKRVEKSGFTSKKQARDSLHKLIAKFENSPGSLINPKIKLSELIEKWLESQKAKKVSKSHIQKCEMVMRDFKQLTGNIYLDSLTSNHLSYYLEKMRKDNLKESTIDINLRVLRICLNSVRRLYPKLLWNPPLLDQKIYKSQRIEPEITVEMIERIISALKEMDTPRSLDVADMVIISSQTALRLGEVISLKWSNVNLIPGIKSPHGRLQFISFKTKQFSQLSITKQVREVLERKLSDQNRDIESIERVFNWNIKHTSMMVKIEHIFSKACKKANILYGRDIEGGIRFHSLRHFVARSLLDAGVDLATVGAFGRWNQKSMIMLYGKATPSSIDLGRKVIESLFDESQFQPSEIRKARG